MQAISPMAAVFGALADNLAKQAEEKRRMKMLDYQNQLALQRQEKAIEGQKDVTKMSIAGSALSRIVGNPRAYTQGTLQQAAQGLESGLEGGNFQMPQEIQAKEPEKVPLEPKIASFFGLPQDQQVPVPEAERMGWQYRTFWQNYQKMKGADKFVNIHGSKVDKSTLLQYLSRWQAMAINNLAKGVPVGINPQTGSPQVTNVPTEAVQPLLDKTNLIINKLVLGKKLSPNDIQFIEQLKNPVGQGLAFYNQMQDISNPNSQAAQQYDQQFGKVGQMLQWLNQNLGKK